MRTLIRTLTLLIALLASPTHAAELDAPIFGRQSADVVNGCIDGTEGHTQRMIGCYEREVQRLDELTAALRTALYPYLSDEEILAVQDADEKWKTYVTANCRLHGAVEIGAPANARLAMRACYVRALIARTNEEIDYYDLVTIVREPPTITQSH